MSSVVEGGPGDKLSSGGKARTQSYQWREDQDTSSVVEGMLKYKPIMEIWVFMSSEVEGRQGVNLSSGGRDGI